MDKLIIYNHTDMPMSEILFYVKTVIRQGRISNNGKQYCCGTSFTDDTYVYSRLNEHSDVLCVTKWKPKSLDTEE